MYVWILFSDMFTWHVLTEVTDISVHLFCSCAIPERPSRDISSQYLHEASETIAIYRPCFCWYSPAVKITSVCTQIPAPFSRHGNAYRADAPHTLRTAGRGGGGGGELNLSLALSIPLGLSSSFFFSGCLSFPGLSHPSILNAIQRLSCFPPLPQRAKPHQAGVRVESCHSKSVCLQIIYCIKGK